MFCSGKEKKNAIQLWDELPIKENLFVQKKKPKSCYFLRSQNKNKQPNKKKANDMGR